MADPEPHLVREQDCPEESWGDIVSWRTLISADRSPTEALTVGTAEIHPGASTDGALHRHQPPEVYYFLAGTGVVHIGDAAYPVEPGMAVFIPANEWHFVANTGTEPLRLLYAFAVDSFDEVRYERPDTAD